MRWLNVLSARLRALFRREAVIGDIDEELRLHVEMETEANVATGMPPDEARAGGAQELRQLGQD